MDDATRRRFALSLVSGGAASLLKPACEDEKPANPMAVKRKDWRPAYLWLEENGELARREEALRAFYHSCALCPRTCGVNRVKGETGFCRATARLKIASAHPHFGEERPLVGRGGSGTIFFSHCNLGCVFCQNWPINHRGDGDYRSEDSLARMMVSLQERGCENINLVTPTHYLPGIIGALRIAIRAGLRLPLVYNCGGYESLEAVRLLDGVVDIYLPDFKYASGEMAARYSSGAAAYPEVAEVVIQEMYRQVGDLVVDERGVALRGLIIRHLVLPENIAGTDRFVRWVSERLGPSVYVNIMAQYRPEYQAFRYPELSRRISRDEYRRALAWAAQAGLTRLDPGT